MTTVTKITGTALVQLSPTISLSIINEGSRITLDEGWAPYAQAEIVVPMPSVADRARLDPRTANIRVDVTIDQEWISPVRTAISRPFQLYLRSRRLDYVNGTMTLSLESGEAPLRDLGYPSSPTDYPNLTTIRKIIVDILARYSFTLTGGEAGVGLDNYTFPVTAAAINQATNPSAQIDTANMTAVNLSSFVRSTVWAAHGTHSYELTTNGSLESFVSPGGDIGGIRLGMVPDVGGFFTTYVISATAHIEAPLSGSENAAVSRRIVAFHKVGASYISTVSAPIANTSGNTQRLTLELPVTAGATEVFFRLYNGHSVGKIYWDAIRVSRKTVGDNYSYFDGSTTDSLYTYAWTGTAGASTSTRTAVSASTDTYLKQTSRESDWDYLTRLLELAGLRLFCDELRVWRLVNPNAYTPAGTLAAGWDTNLTVATDTMSRDSDWAARTYTLYSWRSAASGLDIESRYTGGSGTITKETYVGRDGFPPTDAATTASRLGARNNARGRTFELTSLLDLAATPGQALTIALEGMTTVNAVLKAVTFQMGEDVMPIDSRELFI